MLPGKLHEQFALAAAEYSATGSLKAADDLLARLPPVQRDSPTAIFFRRYWAITRGDYAEFKRLDQLQPAFEEEEWPALTAVTAATVYLAHGDPAAARARLATPMVELQLRVEREPSSPIAGAFLGMAEALLGHPEEAVRLVRKSMELLPESRDALDGPTYRYTLAWVYAVSGDKDRAIAELDRVLHEPSAFSVADIRANPGFEKLHGDPRFEALVNDPKNNAPLF
jgi:tetratricopeptide (TPR) repeat protein